MSTYIMDLTSEEGISRWWNAKENAGWAIISRPFDPKPRGRPRKPAKDKTAEHLRIRLRTPLLEQIDAARAKSGRTRTDEIERRLEASFKGS